MPITKNDFENFYLGNGAEHKIISELFLHGFEAHKFNPDIGIDILATNKAACHFLGKEEQQHHIQVKSTFLINGEAVFYINEQELDFLTGDDKAVLVLCYVSPVIMAEPQSFERGDFEPWWEGEMASFDRHIYENEFKNLKKSGCLSVVDFKQFNIDYIWLNKPQLKKAIDERYIYKSGGFDLYRMILSVNEGGSLQIKGETDIGSPVGEIRNIYYLLKNSRGHGRLASGDFLLEHY
ncbi:hypothetical protein C1Y35_31910 [Pseudomonas sp. GW456-L14]|jgi:hypothetical protein|uniref:hypothetical protein n=1 Tax=unclassified Pseudomonas TaxID=196821 RepID=UPI000C888F29|nr:MULTISPECIES: hypothetical protein [unclassified Pseudomonas]PMY29434.1 hypothetical protein C1Y35_31910 [Pseudomonas sp. GW456-L14]PMY51612.1 hypothetical protein C1Y34_23760 [Pseudomonas sp. GW456-L12]